MGRKPGVKITPQINNTDELLQYPQEIEKFRLRIKKKSIIVDPNNLDSCIEWSGHINKESRARIRCFGKTDNTARLVWLIHNRKPIGDKHILHTCDNPKCVNPNHLWIGTALDNIKDCNKKKRGNHPSGENHYTSKLTKDDVINIRNSSKSGVSLSKQYNVSVSQISSIRNYKTWKDV